MENRLVIHKHGEGTTIFNNVKRPVSPPDVLRVRATRVEKQRPPQKTRATLPSWFHHITAIVEDRNADRADYDEYGYTSCEDFYEETSSRPSDFDEDLSELEEAEEVVVVEEAVVETVECDCKSDAPGCDCYDGHSVGLTMVMMPIITMKWLTNGRSESQYYGRGNKKSNMRRVWKTR
jgi:hypothetical protein